MKNKPLAVNHSKLCVRCGRAFHIGDAVVIHGDGLVCAEPCTVRVHIGPSEYKRAQLNPIPGIASEEVMAKRIAEYLASHKGNRKKETA